MATFEEQFEEVMKKQLERNVWDEIINDLSTPKMRSAEEETATNTVLEFIKNEIVAPIDKYLDKVKKMEVTDGKTAKKTRTKAEPADKPEIRRVRKGAIKFGAPDGGVSRNATRKSKKSD